MKGNKGITLIALVITIIVLLILAGVSIAMLSGENSILSRSREASIRTAISNAKEQIAVAVNEDITNYYDQVYAKGNNTTGAQTIQAYIAASDSKLTAALGVKYDQVTVSTLSDGTGSDDGLKIFTIKYTSSIGSSKEYQTTGKIDANGKLSYVDQNI